MRLFLSSRSVRQRCFAIAVTMTPLLFFMLPSLVQADGSDLGHNRALRAGNRPAGAKCGLKRHCASNRCIGGRCSDGSFDSTCNVILNNCNEGLSCIGGFCANGTEGSSCNSILNNCNSGLCCTGSLPARCENKLAKGVLCGLDVHCQSGSCIDRECADRSEGGTCNVLLNNCNEGLFCADAFPATCGPLLANGENCLVGNDCLSGHCEAKVGLNTGGNSGSFCAIKPVQQQWWLLCCLDNNSNTRRG